MFHLLCLAQLVEHMTVEVQHGYRMVTGSIPVAETSFCLETFFFEIFSQTVICLETVCYFIDMTAPPPSSSSSSPPDVFKTPLTLCECMFEWMYESNPMYAKDKNLKNMFFQKYNISMTINVDNKLNNDSSNDDLVINNNNTNSVMNDDNNNNNHINHDKNNIVDMVDDQLKVPAWDWDAISKKMHDRGVPYSSVHCAILWKYVAYGKKYNDNLYSNAMNDDEDKEDAYYQPFTAIRRFSLCKNSDNPQLFLPSLSFDCKIQDLLQATGVSKLIIMFIMMVMMMILMMILMLLLLMMMMMMMMMVVIKVDQVLSLPTNAFEQQSMLDDMTSNYYYV